MTSPEERLAAARTRLILERPFLGALALRLQLAPAAPHWCATVHTDGKTLYYNVDYVRSLDLDQLQYVVSAQALHCALQHFARRGHRNPERWHRACQHAVHLILLEEGMSAPPATIADRAFKGLVAEEIYPLLEEQTVAGGERSADQSEAGRGDVEGAVRHDAGAGEMVRTRPASPPPDEMHKLAQQWRQRLAGAAQMARDANQLDGGLARLVELVLRPVLPWRHLLARHLNSIARDDFNYSRPSSRRGGPAILPGLRSSQLDLVVAVDVSGSIDANEFSEFMTEVDALKANIRARVTLLACDARVTEGSPWVFEAWERCHLPSQVIGRGATDFRPVFDWIEQQDGPPDLLLYFTDGAGKFPVHEPAYPTLWLVKGSRPVPFGQRVQLN